MFVVVFVVAALVFVAGVVSFPVWLVLCRVGFYALVAASHTHTLAREFTKLLSVRSGAVRLRLSRLDGLNNFQNVSLDVAHLLPLLLLLLLLLPFLLLLWPS